MGGQIEGKETRATGSNDVESIRSLESLRTFLQICNLDAAAKIRDSESTGVKGNISTGLVAPLSTSLVANPMFNYCWEIQGIRQVASRRRPAPSLHHVCKHQLSICSFRSRRRKASFSVASQVCESSEVKIENILDLYDEICPTDLTSS